MIDTENKTENRVFFSRWAHRYDHRLFQFWMKRFQDPVYQEIDFTRKSSLLDISCGTGELLKELSEQNKHRRLILKGLDLTPEMAEKARKKLSSMAKISVGDVHHLPFKSNFFEYVTSTEAFHHYADQHKALKEIARVTKPGGKVIIVDVNFFLGAIHRLFERFEPGCQKMNNRTEMKRLFEQVGLTNIQQRRSFLFAVMTIGIK